MKERGRGKKERERERERDREGGKNWEKDIRETAVANNFVFHFPSGGYLSRYNGFSLLRNSYNYYQFKFNKTWINRLPTISQLNK